MFFTNLYVYPSFATTISLIEMNKNCFLIAIVNIQLPFVWFMIIRQEKKKKKKREILIPCQQTVANGSLLILILWRELTEKNKSLLR